MIIVCRIETHLQRRLLILGEIIGLCQKPFLDSRPSDIGVVKSCSQFMFSAVAF